MNSCYRLTGSGRRNSPSFIYVPKYRACSADRCELPLSSGQGQVLFSEDVAVTLRNGLGQRDPKLQCASEVSFLKSVVSQPEER